MTQNRVAIGALDTSLGNSVVVDLFAKLAN